MKKIFLDNNFRFRFILINSLLAVRNYPADNNNRIAQIQETGCPFLKQADMGMMKSVLSQQKSQESSGAEG
jgi:hypothetical protein